MIFVTEMWHPNSKKMNGINFCIKIHFLIISVYTDGRVCISVLHDPKVDPLNSMEPEAEK
jgi:ubiquitin-protein ligase